VVDKDLLSFAVVTIRNRDGLEIDITDDPAERVRRVESGRLVMSGQEIERLKAAGMTSDKAALLVPFLTAFPGGIVESIEPSSGPYPWDTVEPVQVKEEKDGQRSWW
jgi:hypothetical protein